MIDRFLKIEAFMLLTVILLQTVSFVFGNPLPVTLTVFGDDPSSRPASLHFSVSRK